MHDSCNLKVRNRPYYSKKQIYGMEGFFYGFGIMGLQFFQEH